MNDTIRSMVANTRPLPLTQLRFVLRPQGDGSMLRILQQKFRYADGSEGWNDVPVAEE